jgi:predicted choloylglycine hydrolase
MKKSLEFNGSHYEIGLQMGEILKRTNGYPPKYPQDILEKSHAYEEQVGIFAPDLLDEFRGIADALEIDYYIPITLEATPYRFQMTSCVVLAISGEHTQSGMPVLAHNQEWMERDSENLRVCYTHPEGKLRSLGFTFHWPLVSRYGGINEAGLAFSMASATYLTSSPGIMLNMAARWILDTCRTTEEAVAYLEEIPKVWGETYLIIDKDNTIAKVEAHWERTMVTYSETGLGWNTLIYDSPEMQPYLDHERIVTCGGLALTRKAFLD